MENKISIEYKDKKFDLVFNLNVMQAIQEEYKTTDAWCSLTDGTTGEVNVKALKFGLMHMMNEAIDIANDETGSNEPFVTEKMVGRIITEYGLSKATKAMNDAVIDATKDDAPKNA